MYAREIGPDTEKAVCQATGVGEQILDQDGPPGGMRPVQRAMRVVEYQDLGELWRPARDRVRSASLPSSTRLMAAAQ